MIRLHMVVAALVSLTACAGLAVPAGPTHAAPQAAPSSPVAVEILDLPAIPATSGPAAVADATGLDETLAILATDGYTVATRMGAALARRGVIDKAAYKRLDAAGFKAVEAIGVAYLAGNQRSYLAAIARAKTITDQLGSLVPWKDAK